MECTPGMCTAEHAVEAALFGQKIETFVNQKDCGVQALVSGSTYINGSGRDVDIIIGHALGLDEEEVETIARILQVWDPELRAPHGLSCYSNGCLSLRKGHMNVVVSTASIVLWKLAREVCSALAAGKGSIDKETRVLVHRVLVDGDSPAAAAINSQHLKGTQ